MDAVKESYHDEKPRLPFCRESFDFGNDSTERLCWMSSGLYASSDTVGLEQDILMKILSVFKKPWKRAYGKIKLEVHLVHQVLRRDGG